MKKIVIPVIFVLLSFTSCGPVPISRLGVDSMTMNWGQAGTARALIDGQSEQLFFAYALKGWQSGIMTVGDSTINDRTMDFQVTTLATDGTTLLGSHAQSETFDASDPSIINSINLPPGTKINTDLGVFMNRIGTNTHTTLNLVRPIFSMNPIQGSIETVDEVVVRTAGNIPLSVGDIELITEPHFVHTENSISTGYSGKKDNLVINGDTDYFKDFEYIIFLPSFYVGQDFYYLLRGPIWNPERSDWLSDHAGNATTFAMIDTIAGLTTTDPDIIVLRENNAIWQSTARYFRDFLKKYNASLAIMFNGNGTYPDRLMSSVIIVSMNEDMKLAKHQGIQIDIDFSGSTIDISGGMMTITGTPPLKFSTSIID